MPNKTRKYHSPGRQAQAQQTRARILDAARRAFVQDGYAATMRQVATTAGVSQATVELLFSTKGDLLDAVMDVALAGDDEPVPVLDRTWTQGLRQLSAPDLIDAAGAAFSAAAARVVPILGALDEGSARHPSLTDLAGRLTRQRREMASWVVTNVQRRDALATGLNLDDAIEAVLALLDPHVHRRLLLEQDWSPDQMGRWLGRTLRQILLHPGVQTEHRGGPRSR